MCLRGVRRVRVQRATTCFKSPWRLLPSWNGAQQGVVVQEGEISTAGVQVPRGMREVDGIKGRWAWPARHTHGACRAQSALHCTASGKGRGGRATSLDTARLSLSLPRSPQRKHSWLTHAHTQTHDTTPRTAGAAQKEGFRGGRKQAQECRRGRLGAHERSFVWFSRHCSHANTHTHTHTHAHAHAHTHTLTHIHLHTFTSKLIDVHSIEG